MSYHCPPEDRPRRAKQFLTEREIEDIAISGRREIRQTDDLVITDAARETAADLGISIVAEDSPSAEGKLTKLTAKSPVLFDVVVPLPESSASFSPPGSSAVTDSNASTSMIGTGLSVPQKSLESDLMVKSIVTAVRLLWRTPRRRTRQLARTR